MWKICDKNILKEKFEKLKYCLFKTKEWNEIVLGKRFFASIKG